MITIYGKPSCGFCTKAKNFCETRGFTYEYKDVTNARFMEDLKEAYPEARSVPQIFINGDRIGGFNDLTSYVEETGYTGTGHSL